MTEPAFEREARGPGIAAAARSPRRSTLTPSATSAPRREAAAPTARSASSAAVAAAPRPERRRRGLRHRRRGPCRSPRRHAMTPTAETKPHPIYLAGRWVESPDVAVIANPAQPDEPAGWTYNATAEQYEEAVTAAVAAFETTRKLPAYERSAALRKIADGIAARREEIGRLISTESGKPIRDALTEVDRGVLTFRIGAEEAERIGGEVIPLDLNPASRGRTGIVRRFPIGPIAAISPFNFPLNLAAHKLAPAIASGNPIVLKPPSRDPLTMLTVAEIVSEAGLPDGAVSILPMTRELGDRMVSDERFKLLTFTGSPSVGWKMKERAGKKKVVLELGGNAGVIVDRSANLDWAVRRCVVGAFSYSGQVCISVQRLFVHENVWADFMGRFVEVARALRIGDPLDPGTDIGPMIDEQAVERTKRWVDEAVRGVNNSRFGLQAGVFTN